MESLPLATGPKHVPDGVGDRPLGGSGPAAFGAFRVPWLGQVFLEFPPQWPGHPEVVHFRLCGRLSHRAHLLWRMVMVAIPFSEGCVFVQGSQGSSRIESKVNRGRERASNASGAPALSGCLLVLPPFRGCRPWCLPGRRRSRSLCRCPSLP